MSEEEREEGGGGAELTNRDKSDGKLFVKLRNKGIFWKTKGLEEFEQVT